MTLDKAPLVLFNESLNLTVNMSPELIQNIVKNITDNFPEACQSMDCVKYDYDNLKFTFIDYEDSVKYKIGPDEWLKAIPLMFTDKWPRGLTPYPPCSGDADTWDRWLESVDADSHDAFAQLAIFGDVIYG